LVTTKTIKTPIHGSNPRPPFDLGTAEIQEIKLSQEDKDEIKRILKGRPTQEQIDKWNKQGRPNIGRHYRPPGMNQRLYQIRNTYFQSGKCLICHNLPSCKFVYHLDGINVIQFFCSERRPNLQT
jgi:hypothetical protein